MGDFWIRSRGWHRIRHIGRFAQTQGHYWLVNLNFLTMELFKPNCFAAFIVPFDLAGVTRGRREEKMGIRASSTCDISLSNVRVSGKHVVGELGEGFSIAMAQLQEARIGVAAQALGIAQAALDLAVDYAHKRILFGKQLSDMQLVKVSGSEL